ncbi:conserved hypothetical protein [Xenorhabdus nematophila F1]|uniref:Uncharacterized protein n=1 Tax=Xenorhabdus nematophila (strain ATCC 19061 / DSM 3370 / CCUG 14189 / LMG 1036 / NCIMB 9965 / AN6) TaxID=406817 RepID=D3VEU9_XENNA|nr:hypothetical protein XNC1_2152 [Xenorhabdus nematophila ATCC 19061]CCW32182.1 conserved hypothetical protein [Xenorhabdus nematophila F1]CEE94624.1 hypothetical protein XNA1_4770020 [Xenorhabdus nematophila str. Anatoliense]CEF30402.1 hypothetical protein XNW1_2480052 [Xenorhabdus nematophila str. Websteri]CEK23075.1 hypothetical protein XNC2_2081 [Xenorhabdus nematophila AN6/1]
MLWFIYIDVICYYKLSPDIDQKMTKSHGIMPSYKSMFNF